MFGRAASNGRPDVVLDISNRNYEIKLLYLLWGIGKHYSPPVCVFYRRRYTPHVYISVRYVCGVCDKLLPAGIRKKKNSISLSLTESVFLRTLIVVFLYV